MDSAHTRLVGRLEAISQMGSLLHAASSMEQALEQLAEYAALLMDAPAALVLIAEGDFEYRTGGASGVPDEIRGMTLPRRVAAELGFDRPVPLVLADLAAMPSEPIFVALAAAGFARCLALGLFTETKLHGLLLVLGHSGMAYEEEDLSTFRLFGAQAAAALENVALHELQQHILDTLQEAMLLMPESVPGVSFAHAYRSATETAKVGGDFYDLFEQSEGRLGILIGDVTGNGVQASIVAGLVRHAIRAYALEGHGPARVLELCNRLLEAASSPAVLATAFFGLLDTATGDLTFSNAGHPPPFVRRADGRVEQLWSPFMILGAFPDSDYGEQRATICRGDLLVLYTDGIIEARRGRALFGEARLATVVSAAGDIPSRVVDAVLAALQGFSKGTRRDDLALLAVRLERDPAHA